MRRKPQATEASAPQAAAPAVIHPEGVYVLADVLRLLRLRRSSVRREVREGRLRVARRVGRYYFLGAWLLEWLGAGEVKKSSTPT